MRSNWWMTALAYSEMATLAGVLYALLRERLVGRWPFLFATLAAEVLIDGTLMAFINLHVRYKYYFWTYWISALTLSLLRFGVIADIIRSFPGLNFLPSKLYLFVGAAAAAMATGSALASFHEGSAVAKEMWSTALLLNRSVEVAWITFSLVVLAAVKLLNFGWNPKSARIATGFFFRICSAALISELFVSKLKIVRLSANAMDSLLTIATAIFWFYWISRPPMIENGPSSLPEDSGEITRTISSLLDFCSSRES